MSAHHPPLLSFEESLASGARLHLRQQDALRRAAEATDLDAEATTKVVEVYLRRMSETEIKRGPRKAAAVTALPGQVEINDAIGDGGKDGEPDEPLVA
jgi:hypothetical protein